MHINQRFLFCFFAVHLMIAVVARGHSVVVHERISDAAAEAAGGIQTFLATAGYSAEITFGYTIPDASGLAPLTLTIDGPRWITAGAKWEDEEHIVSAQLSQSEANGFRFINHFYNPIPEPGAPLTDATELPGVWPGLFIHGGFNSFEWGSTRNIIFMGLAGVYPNIYSWQNARDYQADALTQSDPSVRKEAMAKMFFSLGHVIHLIQDTSQPGSSPAGSGRWRTCRCGASRRPQPMAT